VFVSVFVTACETYGVTTETPIRKPTAGTIAVHVEQCIDRTETAGRDLGTEAKLAFEKKLAEAREFTPQANARYRLACEVTIFVKGSAFERWLVPGMGATVGQVSSMLSDTTTGEIVVIVEGNATVAAGGLYTIGAEEYIIPTAVGDVVNRLRSWALGKPIDSTVPPIDIPVRGKQ